MRVVSSIPYAVSTAPDADVFGIHGASVCGTNESPDSIRSCFVSLFTLVTCGYPNVTLCMSGAEGSPVEKVPDIPAESDAEGSH